MSGKKSSRTGKEIETLYKEAKKLYNTDELKSNRRDSAERPDREAVSKHLKGINGCESVDSNGF